MRAGEDTPASSAPLAAWVLLLGAGLAALVLGLVPTGPQWLPSAGAVAVSVALTVALAARTGGRPIVLGAVALGVGVATVVLDEAWLRSGAAVMTAAISAVLGVVVTVPAGRFLAAAREATVAVAVAAVGALACLGYEPSVEPTRFAYLTLGLSLVGALVVVHRLGAGLHGLGRRGVLAVLVGGAVLAATLVYAELLRRYGTPDLVGSVLDGVGRVRSTLGAFPRPVEALVGVPALVWGAHLRARRRQGWWVCAFGAAATASTATSLVEGRVPLAESGLSVLYGLLVGLVLGYLLVRVDLALTGTHGQRARRAERGAALRPEPSRTASLQ